MMSSIIEDTIHHCQTQLKQDRFHYIWNIVDFWNIYKFKIDLYSDKAKNNFRFYMSPQENTLKLYCWIDNDEDEKCKAKNICYSILIESDQTEIARVTLKHIHIEAKTHYLLHSLVTSQLSKIYPQSSNITLTIYFEFFTFIEVFDNNIHYSYKRLAPITDIDIPNHEEKPDSFVTFKTLYGDSFKANKYLLRSRSKVFEDMFNLNESINDDESASNEIEITDTSFYTFKELIFFIETGYCPQSLQNKEFGNICALFIAADTYDIEDLKLICEQHLIICTTTENVVEHLQIANSNNGKVLAKYAKSFIKLYLKVMVNKLEFIALIKMYPELLTEIMNSD